MSDRAPSRVHAAAFLWRCIIDRIEALIAPGVTRDLASFDAPALRALKTEASAVENAVSYYRRLAQGRLEIIAAERDRRARGGSVAELIEALPKILAGESTRGSATNSRFVEPDLAIIDLTWPDGRETLVTGDGALGSMPLLSAEALGDVTERLSAFERELSDDRRRLHAVIDAV